jgi:hypothetical protein
MGHAFQPGIVRAILQKDGLSVYEERRLRNCAVINHQFNIYPTMPGNRALGRRFCP